MKPKPVGEPPDSTWNMKQIAQLGSSQKRQSMKCKANLARRRRAAKASAKATAKAVAEQNTIEESV